MKNLTLSSIRSYVRARMAGSTMQRAMTTRKYFTHVNKPTPHTSMRSSLIASIGLLAVLGAGCTPAKPLPSATQQTATNLSPADQALRNDLEGVWKGIQASLDQPGAKGYGSFLDLELYPELAFLKNSVLDPATIHEIKTTVFYDLSRITFVSVRQEGDWAGYFFLRHPEDNDGFGRKSATSTASLALYPFHRVDGAWKMVPAVLDHTIHLTEDSAKDTKAVQDAVNTMEIKPSRASDEKKKIPQRINE